MQSGYYLFKTVNNISELIFQNQIFYMIPHVVKKENSLYKYWENAEDAVVPHIPPPG